jgi:hypothetical protein
MWKGYHNEFESDMESYPPQYFTFLDTDVIIYDVYLCVCNCQPGVHVFLNTVFVRVV